MAELGQTQDPKALVPGDAGAIASTMWAMRGYGDALREAGEGLARIDTNDGWTGDAADQFRDRFDGEPRKWTEAGDCFHQAANALDAYANSLIWAQGEAAEAIRLWNEAQTETANARAQHDRAVREQAAAGGGPDISFHDPGESKRAAARQRLADARERLDSAGNTAKGTVGSARDKAPDKPGFWSKLGDALVDFGMGTVNALASVGNAILHHPGDVALAAGGALLAGVSAGGEGLGVALDATGVGAVAGVPLNVVSAAGMAAGATMVVAATGDILHHAATDDRVEPLQREESGDLGGKSGTKTDRLKEHLTERDLDAARRELNGEVVARKPNGQPFDHVDEVQNAQRGLLNRIRQLQRELGDTRLSDAERATRQAELSEASRLLDHSEGFVPRP
ncbi:MAG TPA: polymorphic toxin type 28 domain-containing protein [Candidatus Limnocylindrales bacterium]|nr:polymorphic toxin type 28 domain-containing protein [Candidatus Limnocylindrales bacterium]